MHNLKNSLKDCLVQCPTSTIILQLRNSILAFISPLDETPEGSSPLAGNFYTFKSKSDSTTQLYILH